MKKNSLLLFIAILFPSMLNSIKAQNFDWVKGTGKNCSSKYLTTDSNENIYVAGEIYSDTVDLDPGPGVFKVRKPGAFGDIFILKLDKKGNFKWAKVYGGNNSDVLNGLTTDSHDNVYINGYFRDTLDFDPGSGVTNLIANGSDAYVLKLDSSGNFKWAKSMGAPGSFMNPANLLIDKNDNIIFTSRYTKTTDIDFGTGTSFLTPNSPNGNIVVAKYDSNLNLIWGKSFGGNSTNFPYNTAVDQDGDIYLSGSFHGTTDFDPGSDTFNLTSKTPTKRDAFISKLNAAGNFIWAKSVGGKNSEFCYGLKLDANKNVYIVGSFESDTIYSPASGINGLISSGMKDIFFCKINANGTWAWAKSIGGTMDETPQSLAVSPNGPIYLTGSFNSANVDFNPGTGVNTLSTSGMNDIFICKFDLGGNFMDAKQIGSSGIDEGRDIVITKNNNLLLTGAFSGTVNFNSPLTENLTCLGAFEIFVLKYKNTFTDINQDNTANNNNIVVYPSPTQNELNVVFTDHHEISDYSLTNILGEVVKEAKNLNSSTIQISIPDITSGLYFLNLKSNNKIYTYKVVKE